MLTDCAIVEGTRKRRTGTKANENMLAESYEEGRQRQPFYTEPVYSGRAMSTGLDISSIDETASFNCTAAHSQTVSAYAGRRCVQIVETVEVRLSFAELFPRISNSKL
jgi:hypothetical protein